MATGFRVITVVPSTDVDTDDTVAFAFYGDDAAADYLTTGFKLAVEGLQVVLDQGNTAFTVAITSVITITWKGSTTIPAGSVLKLQAPLYEPADVGGDAQPAILDWTLTAVAGTANSTSEAVPNPTDTPATADALRDDLVATLIPPIRNNFADLGTKVNAILAALRVAGIITP